MTSVFRAVAGLLLVVFACSCRGSPASPSAGAAQALRDRLGIDARIGYTEVSSGGEHRMSVVAVLARRPAPIERDRIEEIVRAAFASPISDLRIETAGAAGAPREAPCGH
jgi:hypothetical protein